MKDRIIIGLSAASGAGYCLELLKALQDRRDDIDIELIYTNNSLMILENERSVTEKDLNILVDRLVDQEKMDDPVASGSNPFSSMIICPCSTSTVAKIHSGIADNLMTRCASVALKEKRRLILIVRETPLSTPILKAMADLSSWDVIVMPASPAFYGMTDPTGEDLQRSLAGRVLDLVGIENSATPRYRSDP